MKLYADQPPMPLEGIWKRWWNILFWCPSVSWCACVALAHFIEPLNRLSIVDFSVLAGAAILGCLVIAALAPNRVVAKLHLGVTALVGISMFFVMSVIATLFATLVFHVFRT